MIVQRHLDFLVQTTHLDSTTDAQHDSVWLPACYDWALQARVF